MDRNMSELAESIFSQPSSALEEPSPQPIPYAEDTVLLACFSTMLQQVLSKACSIITNDTKQDIQNFGLRLDMIETKVDGMVARVNHNIRVISVLQEQLEEAYAKIEDQKMTKNGNQVPPQ